MSDIYVKENPVHFNYLPSSNAYASYGAYFQESNYVALGVGEP